MNPDTFPAVLDRTIERSGMSLEHLQRRLSAHGIRVSLSTLSYWRRGRTRPERPESLKAVSVMEDVLELPPGGLTALLGPRKPRGRWASRAGTTRTPELLWRDCGGVEAALSALDDPVPGTLTYLTIHDHHHVDQERRDSRTVVRMVLRAEADGLRSCVVLHRAEETDRTLPVLVAGPGCAVGRVRAQSAGRFTVAEILFDRTLSIGQTALVEYEVRWFGTSTAIRYSRGMRRGPREYLAQVSFHPAALPTRCHAFTQADAWAPETGGGVLRIGAFSGVHALVSEPASAIVGIRWQW
ncbi:helix-turn-helix domain-containing protein [Actinokineospora sp. 24-640]